MKGPPSRENECVHFLWNAAPALPMFRISPLRLLKRSSEDTDQRTDDKTTGEEDRGQQDKKTETSVRSITPYLLSSYQMDLT